MRRPRRTPSPSPIPGFFSRFQGEVPAPPRQGRLDTVLIVAAVALLAASGPLPTRFFPFLPPLVGLLALAGLARRSPYALHAGLLAAFSLGFWEVPMVGRLWPLPLLLILAAYAVVVVRVPDLRSTALWARAGTWDRSTLFQTLLFGLVAAGGVTAWRFLAHPDLGASRALFPTDVPFWSIPPGIVLYAALNAAYEEILWRGVLTHSLEAALGRGRASLALQAAAFGLWHYHGFPNGWLGSGLAAFFAWMMGLLRRRSGGMLAPWAAHAFTDAVIYVLVAFLVLGS